MKVKHGHLLALVMVSALAAPSSEAGDIAMARNLVNKGNFQMAAGHFSEALKSYEEASKIEPGNAVIRENIAKVYNNWACWYTRQKKYYEANEKLEKCLEISPGYGQARNNLALLKRQAEEDGVDLDVPPNEDKKDIPIPPPNAGPAKVQAPKVAPTEPESGAFLIIGGVKQPQVNPTAPLTVDSYPIGATSAPPAQQTPVVSSPASGATLLSSPAEPATNNWSSKPVNPLFPVTPNQFPQLPVNSAAQTTRNYAQQPPASNFQQPSSYQPVPNVNVSSAPTLDEQLTSVEMKVYGSKQADLTVLQRLEKIERDAAGQVRTGTIVERIDYLKRSFGLQ